MSVFDWDTKEPSIFCAPAALKYAKASLTSSANVSAQQPKKKHVVPDIKTRVKRVIVGRTGRPAIPIDKDLLHKMRAQGVSQENCALFFCVSAPTIRRALGVLTLPNSSSRFNVSIATREQSDRTNSIAGRA